MRKAITIATLLSLLLSWCSIATSQVKQSSGIETYLKVAPISDRHWDNTQEVTFGAHRCPVMLAIEGTKDILKLVNM